MQRRPLVIAFALLSMSIPALAQSAALTGTVRDPQDATIPSAKATLTNQQTKVAQSTETDDSGNYEFPVVRPGTYSLKIERAGFRTFLQNDIVLAVTQRGRVDVSLTVGDTATVLTVEASAGGVQTESSSLGTVVDTKKIVEVPLNGRFFLDLALLTAGTVVPSTSNRTFLAAPSGIGISGINASGTREDSTNYLFDGINLSDMVQNQITFQPNIDMIQEFKVQTNSFNAEYGRNAGIIINAVSKSGTNGFHGSAFEFVRNERFDAKNFFDRANQPIAPFKRNIFGYSIGGPIIRNKTFFFHSYEGRQGREVATLNAPVPNEVQRAAVTNPVIKQLLPLIPRANDSTGGFFQGSAPRRRTLNQFTGRFDHSFTPNDLLFGTFISNRDERTEPTLQNNNLPGFGDTRPAKRMLLAIGYTKILAPTVTNEFRAGLNRVRIDFMQDTKLNPNDFGIRSPSSVFPQIIVAGGGGGGPEFGGISGFPQGRGDTTFQYNDTLAVIKGRHSLKIGAEYRRFRNNNFNYGTGGIINFASMATFLAGTPSSATETALAVTPGYRVNALGIFVQDDFKITQRLALNLGVRWEYNGIPREIHNRLGVYDIAQNKLVPIGTNGVDLPYQKQYTNFGPRIGFSYDPIGKGKTVIRGGTGFYYDQPVTNILGGLSTNPPFSASVNNTSNINVANPFAVPPGGSSAIGAIDPNFKSGRVLSYNTNIQHEAFGTVFQATYVGSTGRHLRILGDLNQGILGVRPIPGFSSITYQQSVSNSSYNGLWLSAEKRFTKGLTFQTSYTFSKSIDNNSVGSSNPQVQDYRNLAAERALSDFDARQRFVLSGVYQLPLPKGPNGLTRRLMDGWTVAPIVNLQSGNPFSPIINAADARGSLLAFNRPFVNLGVPLYTPNPDPSGFVNRAAFTQQATGFGNAGRNILTAPGFQDIDFSVAKNTRIRESVSVQFRAEAFNLFNHPNFGQPVNNLLAANFGQITATRTTRGDLGSSRQIQLGIKLLF
ncbi:MAG: TonB-dependent receptor [Acidobacteria bacterium]|nr:TonB-dependent receptor [Acidobacteriota bacterium]